MGEAERANRRRTGSLDEFIPGSPWDERILQVAEELLDASNQHVVVCHLAKIRRSAGIQEPLRQIDHLLVASKHRTELPAPPNDHCFGNERTAHPGTRYRPSVRSERRSSSVTQWMTKCGIIGWQAGTQSAKRREHVFPAVGVPPGRGTHGNGAVCLQST